MLSFMANSQNKVYGKIIPRYEVMRVEAEVEEALCPAVLVVILKSLSTHTLKSLKRGGRSVSWPTEGAWALERSPVSPFDKTL